MTKVYLHTFGCKANQYDTEVVRQALESAGAAVVDDPSLADAAVINSCTVTHVGERKMRGHVRQIARANEGLRTVVMGCAAALDDGTIAYAEELDSSQANKNMVRGIWFNKMVAVTVAKDAVAYQIKGKPYKCLITGALFKQFLMEAREKKGPDSDIQSVWIITPEEVRDATTAQRVKDEEQTRPFFNRHLDRESLRKDK